jgi:C_GCAxxG_C_C family probable redox protein
MTNDGSAADRAVALFQNGSACSQAVLAAFAPHAGIDEQTAHRLGTGFGAGMGRKQYVCGAVTGAVAVLSLVHGNSDPARVDLKENTYSAVHQLIEKTEATLGSSSCMELLGTNISTEEGKAEANRKNLFSEVCPNCIRTVAAYLESMLSESDQIRD